MDSKVKFIEVPGRRIERLRLSQLILPECQRNQEKQHIADMAEWFEAEAFGLPLVFYREWSGEYALGDGQQRCAAALLEARSYGYEDIEIECEVIPVSCPARESELFCLRNNHKKVGLVDRLWAKLDYGDPDTVRLHEIYQSLGKEFYPRSSEIREGKRRKIDHTRVINGCNYTRRLLKEKGESRLRQVILFSDNAFSGEKDATGQKQLEGINYLIENLDAETAPTLTNIARTIRGRFVEIRLQTESRQRKEGVPASRAFAESVRDTYNKYRETKGRGTKVQLKG